MNIPAERKIETEQALFEAMKNIQGQWTFVETSAPIGIRSLLEYGLERIGFKVDVFVFDQGVTIEPIWQNILKRMGVAIEKHHVILINSLNNEGILPLINFLNSNVPSIDQPTLVVCGYHLEVFLGSLDNKAPQFWEIGQLRFQLANKFYKKKSDKAEIYRVIARMHQEIGDYLTGISYMKKALNMLTGFKEDVHIKDVMKLQKWYTKKIDDQVLIRRMHFEESTDYVHTKAYIWLLELSKMAEDLDFFTSIYAIGLAGKLIHKKAITLEENFGLLGYLLYAPIEKMDDYTKEYIKRRVIEVEGLHKAWQHYLIGLSQHRNLCQANPHLSPIWHRAHDLQHTIDRKQGLAQQKIEITAMERYEAMNQLFMCAHDQRPLVLLKMMAEVLKARTVKCLLIDKNKGVIEDYKITNDQVQVMEGYAEKMAQYVFDHGNTIWIGEGSENRNAHYDPYLLDRHEIEILLLPFELWIGQQCLIYIEVSGNIGDYARAKYQSILGQYTFLNQLYNRQIQLSDHRGLIR